jgi:hypothetical protein
MAQVLQQQRYAVRPGMAPLDNKNALTHIKLQTSRQRHGSKTESATVMQTS